MTKSLEVCCGEIDSVQQMVQKLFTKLFDSINIDDVFNGDKVDKTMVSGLVGQTATGQMIAAGARAGPHLPLGLSTIHSKHQAINNFTYS